MKTESENYLPNTSGRQRRRIIRKLGVTPNQVFAPEFRRHYTPGAATI
jgi:hypothetical protein